jgi:hypothetical protein
MAANILAAQQQPIYPQLDQALAVAVRAEMRRLEVAADWAALVADCAARGMP